MAASKNVRKKAKKQAFRLLVFGAVCLFIIGGILTSLTKVWINIYDKYKEKCNTLLENRKGWLEE